MHNIGYHASHEQFAPSVLLANVTAAETAGFSAISCSDHFHPWSIRQGHSGNAWVWLGAALSAASLSAGVVNCPFGRYHPAVIAQACATLSEMFPGRFWIAAGSGEALNEHITGRPWPEKKIRNQMLRESVDVMRALWRGEEVDHQGVIRVDRTRLFSLPAAPPPVFCAALTEATARWAGQWADGLITVSGDPAKVEPLLNAFREAGGAEKPIYLQAKIAYVPASEGGDLAARQMAFEQWRTNIFDSTIAASLQMPGDFDAKAAGVSLRDMDNFVRISSDLGRHADWIMDDFELGVDHVFLHNVGTNQLQTIRDFGEHVLPKFMRPF